MACVSINNNHSQIDGTNNNTAILINQDDEPLITIDKISLSSPNAQSIDHPLICRLCHCQGINDEPLIAPCYCLGTMQYLHQSCLQRLIKNTNIKSCELCKCEFIMHAETKPFKQWQKLNMNASEICKVVCSATCSLLTCTFVLWSLYVLIEKTRDEIKTGKLQWPFWSKLIVVAIFLAGGLGCLCVQFNMYIKLCIRWRRFNQRIVIRSRYDQENDNKFPSRMTYSYKNRDECIVTVPDGND